MMGRVMPLVAVLFLSVPACKNVGAPFDAYHGTDGDSDSDVDSDTDSDADTDPDTDSDTESGSDSNTETGTDADTDVDTDVDADADTDTESATVSDDYYVASFPYTWLEISSTGSAVYLADDGASGGLDIGFSFLLYSAAWTQVSINANGLLVFAGSSSSLSSPCPLAPGSGPTDLIALMWDDLNPAATGDAAYYRHFDDCPVGSGECFVVQYQNYHHFGSPTGIAGTFEAILFENGSVLLQFADGGDEEGVNSTTGILSGDEALTFACDVAGSLTDGMSLCFVAPYTGGC